VVVGTVDAQASGAVGTVDAVVAIVHIIRIYSCLSEWAGYLFVFYILFATYIKLSLLGSWAGQQKMEAALS
jgi:hypothetical protein